MSNVDLSPFQRFFTDDHNVMRLQEWLDKLSRRIVGGPFLVKGYSVSSLPDASAWGSASADSSLIYVYDETGGATLAFSDGTNWRRVQDRTIVA